MASQIEEQRRINQVLLPPIKKANELATNLKKRSDLLKIEIAKTQALLAKKRASAKTSPSKGLSPLTKKRIKLN